MADLLDMNYINSLPQPFMGRTRSGWWWPIYDIDVETGLIRIDVCGKLEAKHIADFTAFRDDTGVERSSEAFYVDANEYERRALSSPTSPASSPTEGVSLADRIQKLPARFPTSISTHSDNVRWWRSGFEAARDQAAALVAASTPSPSSPTGGGAASEVALWQYRWLNPADDTNVPPSMLEWKIVKPWNRSQTLEQRIAELRDYRYNGKPVYEVRALGAIASGPSPSDGQEAIDLWKRWSVAGQVMYLKGFLSALEDIRVLPSDGQESGGGGVPWIGDPQNPPIEPQCCGGKPECDAREYCAAASVGQAASNEGGKE